MDVLVLEPKDWSVPSEGSKANSDFGNGIPLKSSKINISIALVVAFCMLLKSMSMKGYSIHEEGKNMN